VTSESTSATGSPDPSASLRASCANCGAPLTGRWCAACGQEDRPLDPSLREVVGDVWEAISNVDGRVLQSLRRLFLSPGFLTREYLEGRRVRWLAPVRLYLVVSVAYFGLTSLTGWGGFYISADPTGATSAEEQAELQSLGYASDSELDLAARDAVSVWLPRAMFLLVPVFGLMVALGRRRARRSYPHHLVFSLHAHAAFFGAFTVTALADGAFGDGPITSAVGLLSMLYSLAYIVLALRTVYGGSVRRALAEGVVIGASYFVLTIATAVAILVPVIFRTR